MVASLSRNWLLPRNSLSVLNWWQRESKLARKLLRFHLELAVSIATHTWIVLENMKLGGTTPLTVDLLVPATGAEIMWLADAIWRTSLKSLWLSKTTSSLMICVGFCFSRLRKQTEFKKRKKYFLFLERGFFFCFIKILRFYIAFFYKCDIL